MKTFSSEFFKEPLISTLLGVAILVFPDMPARLRVSLFDQFDIECYVALDLYDNLSEIKRPMTTKKFFLSAIIKQIWN